MRAIGYTTHGPVRGQCGHLHRSIRAAEDCLRSDQRGCRSQGDYSDRAIRAVGFDRLLYYGDDCRDWVPAEGGPSNGAMRFSR